MLSRYLNFELIQFLFVILKTLMIAFDKPGKRF